MEKRKVSTGESVYDQSTMTAVASSTDNSILTKQQIDDKGARVIWDGTILLSVIETQ